MRVARDIIRLGAVLPLMAVSIGCGIQVTKEGQVDAQTRAEQVRIEQERAADEIETSGSAPAQVFKQSFSAKSRDQSGRDYDLLHPEHQALVSRTDYEKCVRKDVGTDELEVAVVHDELTDISPSLKRRPT